MTDERLDVLDAGTRRLTFPEERELLDELNRARHVETGQAATIAQLRDALAQQKEMTKRAVEELRRLKAVSP